MPAVRARRVFAVVPAAGRGTRFDPSVEGTPKQYAPLCGATVIEWSLRALLEEPRIEKVVVVAAADDMRWPALAATLAERSPALCAKLAGAIGGASRQESVLNGLRALEQVAVPDDWVLVHDAARPCLEGAEVRALIAALDSGAAGAVLAAPIVDTVKRGNDGVVAETVDRSGLWRALTPQVFALGELEYALSEAARRGALVTDEAQAMERLGSHPQLVPGSPFNIKVTCADDLAIASRILGTAAERIPGGDVSSMRIGQGFDVHAFGEGDHVMLGGVRIPYGRGVVAHSDGDVAIHALCDAVLGALGEGDIGRHFPDTDPRYRGADSRVFLRTVAGLMRSAGLKLVNADVTLLAEAPRIAAHRSAIAATLAADLAVEARLVNIKATTTERMGFIGRGEGLAAFATVLLAPA